MNFFDTIESYLKSKYIVFEFKNYSKYISQREVCITEKYLYETSFRKVAIIITRKGVNEGGIKLIEGILRETDKLILVINDDDIKNMIKLKESGQDPSVILTKKLDFQFICLGK